jgi:hypothetical protein
MRNIVNARGDGWCRLCSEDVDGFRTEGELAYFAASGLVGECNGDVTPIMLDNNSIDKRRQTD